MSFPRYPAYKSSGVEWLGEVPEHWEVLPLKRRARLLTEKTETTENPVALENIEGWTGRFVETESEFQGEGVAFQRGDILFGKLRPYLAKVYLASSQGQAVGDFHVIHPDSLFRPKYLKFQLLTKELIDLASGSTYGAKMPRASWDFLGSLHLSIPPLNEQEVIATFLDRETAKIDALITEQQRLIELLQEKRQAVISHAVTKGLNPDAPMKDSGVEWLGEVPEHWEVRKFAWDFVSAMGQTILREDLEDTGLPIFSATEDDRYFGLISNPKVHLEPGDIVIPARGNCIGAVKLVKEPASATQTTIYAKQISSKFSADYIFYFLRFNREHLFPMTRTAIPQITVTEVGSNRVCLPPVTEQRQIVEYIHSIDRAFQELMSESGSGIALLQERRSALISAAVTGQIDVRGLAPETSGA